MIRMNIKNLMVGGGPIPSGIVLTPSDEDKSSLSELPIRIGMVDAINIGTGIDTTDHTRPLTHDLLANVISLMGGTLKSVCISRVEGNTFFATLNVEDAQGGMHAIDARPSDAIALAVRTGIDIFASEDVLMRAGSPDFEAIEADENELKAAEFHEFLQTLRPEDFN